MADLPFLNGGEAGVKYSSQIRLTQAFLFPKPLIFSGDISSALPLRIASYSAMRCALIRPEVCNPRAVSCSSSRMRIYAVSLSSPTSVNSPVAIATCNCRSLNSRRSQVAGPMSRSANRCGKLVDWKLRKPDKSRFLMQFFQVLLSWRNSSGPRPRRRSSGGS